MTSRSGRRPQPSDRAGSVPTPALWSERADMAESAIISRHLRLLWGCPGTELGVVGWPATRRDRAFAGWHYWWQAHLLDVAVDAANRVPTPARRRRIGAIARAIRLRNITGWTNRYYDDMAWLAIALERAERTQELTSARSGLIALEHKLYGAWEPEVGGGIPWRIKSDFFNAPANGPAGIALLRLGRVERAREMADWIDATLRDAESGLILDGIHLPSGEIERPVFSYCQGVVLGLEAELAVHTDDDERHIERVSSLLAAVEEHMTTRLVINGGGGGDGGLFNGVLARYLAVVALMLPGEGKQADTDRRTAAAIVKASATAAWANRLEVEGEPLFGYDWSKPARLPGGTAGAGKFTAGGSVTASAVPERDMSVQLAGWMLMEAAYQVSAAGL